MKLFIITLFALASLSALAQPASLKQECLEKGLNVAHKVFGDQFEISEVTKLSGSKDYQFIIDDLKIGCSYLYRCRVENSKVKSVDYTGHSDCNMAD